MSCTHANQKPYSYAFGRRETSLCDDCYAAVSAVGMVLRLIERERPFRAPWLDRLTSRDETGRSVA